MPAKQGFEEVFTFAGVLLNLCHFLFQQHVLALKLISEDPKTGAQTNISVTSITIEGEGNKNMNYQVPISNEFQKINLAFG